ncbi:tyrosine-protein phosphatase [Gymnodinialimonas sp. 57CJ19]|uniref:phosphatase domain-containing putative toxin n=1 Tax=Gymnodinialimonas sp. 57CJ19 TaxID=3138498 RepID=UPI0031344A8F
MSLSLSQKALGAWDVVTRRYDQKIDSALGRWQGQFFANMVDHGILRKRWTNEGQIAEGLYRSNHPHVGTLAQWKARGIVEVISLRPANNAVQLFEAEACDALGLTLRNVPLTARQAPSADALLRLLDTFDTIQLPALIHCKSGADRTGLAAAMWAIHVEGKPVAEAKRALGFKHLHIRASKTGVLDRVLEAYEARVAKAPISLRDWIATEYDPASL